MSLFAKRVLLVCSCALLSGWFAYRSARAQFEDRMLLWGRLVFDIPTDWVVAAPRTLVLNGARLSITTARSELPLAALLDRLQASCRSRSRITDELSKRASQETSVRPSELPSLANGVLRIASEREGVIACLDLGEQALGYRAVLDRLSAFGESGDLSAIGGVRMVRAEAREQGAFFVVAASEGSLPLSAMFPEQGDAPGSDLPTPGRPADARRVLTVWQENAEPSISLYESTKRVRPSWDAYLERCQATGMQVLTASPVTEKGAAALLAHEGHHYVLLATQHDEHTLLAIGALNRGLGVADLKMRATAAPLAR